MPRRRQPAAASDGEASHRGRRVGAPMLSHDDTRAETRAWFRDHGASVAEFPMVLEAAQAARDAGWAAQTRGDTADALVANLIARRPPAPLLHLCGRHRRGQIAERLTQAGLPTSECAIYDQRLLGAPSEVQARLNAGQTVIAPVFSPRTARQFVEEFATLGHIHAIALSDAVADPLLSCGFASVSTACRPDARAMAEELRRVLAETARLEAKGSAQ